MEIPTYQIHKVMKVYIRQLTQTRMLEHRDAHGTKVAADRIMLSAEGKRQAIIDKVASDIVEKIKTFGPHDVFEQEIADQREGDSGQKITFQSALQSEFVFNVIDEENNKKTNMLSLEDSRVLIKKLEELAKKAVIKDIGLQ